MGRKKARAAAILSLVAAPALPLAAGVMVCLGARARRCKVRC
ncbi:hypothetical protein WMF04_01110 [Sorangium sp. So ce260]